MKTDKWLLAVNSLCGQIGAEATVDLSEKREIAESLLGHGLPDSLVECMSRIEAQPLLASAVLADFRMLRIDEAVAIWSAQSALAEDEEEVCSDVAGEVDARVLNLIHDVNRFPVAEYNGDVWIYIDFLPSEKGSAGQVIQVDSEALNWFWLASNFDRLIIDVANGRALDPDLGTQD